MSNSGSLLESLARASGAGKTAANRNDGARRADSRARADEHRLLEPEADMSELRRE